MSKTNFREYDDAKLGETLTELKKELMNLRFRSAHKDVTNTSRISIVKKEIARVLTIINERKIRGKNA